MLRTSSTVRPVPIAEGIRSGGGDGVCDVGRAPLRSREAAKSFGVLEEEQEALRLEFRRS